MEKKKIIMLGAGPLQVPAIQELKKLGAYVICLDQNPNAEGFLWADESRVISTLDLEAVCEEFGTQKADVIMTSTSDMPVRIVSQVCGRFDIPCALSYEDACAVTDKSRMRKRLQEWNVPVPGYQIIHHADELKAAFYEVFGKKCMIKPADNAGSRGVKLLRGSYTDTELEKEYLKCREYSRNGLVLAEEVMCGPEVSVEAVTVEGQTSILAVTDKIVCEKPYFVEIGHVEPSRLSKAVQEDIVRTAKAAVKAMHIKNGVSHTEIMVTESGAKIVEIAARLGGDFITSRLVPLSTGINMVRESVKLALGMEVCLEKTCEKGAAVRFLTAEKSGIVEKIEGMEEALNQEGIVEISVYVRPGDSVNALHSSSDRIGHLIVQAEDAGKALIYAEKAFQKIHISIK